MTEPSQEQEAPEAPIVALGSKVKGKGPQLRPDADEDGLEAFIKATGEDPRDSEDVLDPLEDAPAEPAAVAPQEPDEEPEPEEDTEDEEPADSEPAASEDERDPREVERARAWLTLKRVNVPEGLSDEEVVDMRSGLEQTIREETERAAAAARPQQTDQGREAAGETEPTSAGPAVSIPDLAKVKQSLSDELGEQAADVVTSAIEAIAGPALQAAEDAKRSLAAEREGQAAEEIGRITASLGERFHALPEVHDEIVARMQALAQVPNIVDPSLSRAEKFEALMVMAARAMELQEVTPEKNGATKPARVKQKRSRATVSSARPKPRLTPEQNDWAVFQKTEQRRRANEY